ncbi:cytidine deaminase [Suillus fuscotomentosus]|uniref:Cytidine deaminase n=1 Tax=Suillus fuscotomentosus TaxID=1912939 RepID=A0AAD4HHU6_9AGAM|nr:cytidine deaminase [Suillus fuscotomentosus]KAG1897163.1 cytidine deaminase [Suillus fuscotomentosus]
MTDIVASNRDRLLQAAVEAKTFAYVPYSKFRVGAALLTEDGEIIKGANIENASYGGTICAERTAFVKAVSEGHRKFVALAVTTDVASSIAPCGMCRQVIREFCPLDMPILLAASSYLEKEDGVRECTLEELLPFSFGPEDLERDRG